MKENEEEKGKEDGNEEGEKEEEKGNKDGNEENVNLEEEKKVNKETKNQDQNSWQEELNEKGKTVSWKMLLEKNEAMGNK